MSDLPSLNEHACAVILGTSGVLIRGNSGSGKTSLALRLIDFTHANCKYSSLIADDQVVISAINGRVIARRPENIAHLVEIRGLGLQAQCSVESAVIHLEVEIIDPEKIDRLPEKGNVDIYGVSIPIVRVPKYREDQAIQIILRTLGNNIQKYGCTP